MESRGIYRQSLSLAWLRTRAALGVRPKSLKLIRAAAELRLIDVPRGAATLWLHSFRPRL